jgi:hypothetical protein
MSDKSSFFAELKTCGDVGNGTRLDNPALLRRGGRCRAIVEQGFAGIWYLDF